MQAPPSPVRRPQPSPAEPPLLQLPPCVSAQKLAELREAREGQVPLSCSAPGDFAGFPVATLLPEVDEFMMSGLDDAADDDGCLFALDDEEDEGTPESKGAPVSPVSKFRTSSMDSVASTAPGTPPIDFAGSPVLHACLLDLQTKKRARAGSRDR